jgi:hypothetical protein
MLIKILRSMSVLTLILILAPACAKQDDGAGATAENKPAAETAAPSPAADKPSAAAPAGTDMSIMDQPVNFSTPEDVDKSIEAVRQQAGAAQARDLKNALGYILTYDLSLGRNKEKMYKKLNGRTPNEIIAKMNR